MSSFVPPGFRRAESSVNAESSAAAGRRVELPAETGRETALVFRGRMFVPTAASSSETQRGKNTHRVTLT